MADAPTFLAMTAAEAWAAARGLESVVLSSQLDRHGAHAFYARLGYSEAARAVLLRKQLDV